MAIESARLLAITDRPFRRVLQLVTGCPPDLVLVSQSTQPPPHSSIAVPPLPWDDDLLVRRSSYVHRGSVLSRHVSFVTASSLSGWIMAALREAHMDLREVVATERVQKLDFSFGRTGTEDSVDKAILEGFGADGFLPEFVWRRYVGTIREEPAFVILEALPVELPPSGRSSLALLGSSTSPYEPPDAPAGAPPRSRRHGQCLFGPSPRCER
jgi:hypothetical protein